ncbi:MAG TPA: YcaO-like family protein [Chloroflexota bacterium]|nr:YcaO-like family protein [Chloroflexota bacterium]
MSESIAAGRLTDDAGKAYVTGTHRTTSPDETVRRIRELLSAMGITRVANVTGLDRIGIPVVMVTRPNSRSLSVSQGKGVDLAAARASGIMESIEMFHGECVDLPLRRTSWEELQPAVDVWRLPRPLKSPFHPRRQLLWVEGHDLNQDTPKWVPFDSVDTNFDPEVRTAPTSFIASTNGLASGNHLAEAISHGLCEVIERDAVTLFGLSGENARRERRLDLTTVDDFLCRSLLEKYERAGVGVAIWEITTDVGVPTYRCVVSELNVNRVRPLPSAGGFGCHPTRRIALLRALTEAAQSRLTMIAGARDDMFRESYELAFQEEALRRTQRIVTSNPGSRDFRGAPNFESENLGDDVSWLLERLRRAGFSEAVAVNLSKPDIGLPVVKVIVPGLEFVDTSSHRGAKYQYGDRAKRVMQARRDDDALRTVIDLYDAAAGQANGRVRDRADAGFGAAGATNGTALPDPLPPVEEASLLVRTQQDRPVDVCIFVGPTLTVAEAREHLDAVYLPPISQGDVYRVMGMRPRAIGIIDGFFESVPAVWHKEILWAMSQGIHVFGSSSMGALRAAELEPFGMEGVGSIFEAYRDGVLEDDDEVAVLHGPRQTGFHALSDAMVDIRFTLRRAVLDGVVSAADGAALEAIAKNLHYTDRSFAEMLRVAREAPGASPSFDRLESWLPCGRVQQKRIDAIALLRTVRSRLEAGLQPKQAAFHFQPTTTSERARTHAGSRVEPGRTGVDIRTAAVLEELKLLPKRFERVKAEAISRRTLLAEAERGGLPLEQAVLDRELGLLQTTHGLQTERELDEWRERQDLSEERLRQVLANQGAVRRAAVALEHGLLEPMVETLQLSGEYAMLKRRAQDKQEKLDSAGLSRIGPGAVGTSTPELLEWYFKERLSAPVPRDLASYARLLGFMEPRELVTAILREYCYVKVVSPPTGAYRTHVTGQVTQEVN